MTKGRREKERADAFIVSLYKKEENVMLNASVSIMEVLDDPEGRRLVELIEELVGETEPSLVEMRRRYIEELYDKFAYKYHLDKESVS